MKVADFINTDFKAYVEYDNQRKLPNIMDGQMITRRKLLYAFIEDIGTKSIVVDKAGMRAASVTMYRHGATSMIGALIDMSKDYIGTNNLPLFKKEGQFGTRMSHKPSSERYISTRLSSVFNKLFDTDDNHILEYQYDGGDRIEPLTYVPKLPLILINGAQGTGNGYACNILSYEINDIKQSVEEVLETGLVQNKLTPYYEGYQGEISKNHVTGQVTFEGVFERKNATTIIITELPPSMQLEKYKSILNDLMESTKDKKGEVVAPLIKDYENESTEDGWRFIIDCPRSTTALTDDELMSAFKLIERDTETIAAWSPNGKKILRPSSIEALIETWVKLRLEFYEMRRLNKISRYNIDLDWLNVKRQFIEWWNANSTVLVVLKKSALLEEIKKNITDNDGYVNRLLSIQVRNLGSDEVGELVKEISKIESDRKKMENTTNKKMMSKEVADINF